MKDDTVLAHVGSRPEEQSGAVNPPVHHASTIIFPTIKALESRGSARVSYGRKGTPTTHALEDAFTELEGGAGTLIVPSGLSAATMALTAFAAPGAHMLVADSTYQPTRQFCSTQLVRFGVQVEFYDPRIGAGISSLLRKETTAIWMESPGSDTFEVQDLPAIAAIARSAGIPVMIDNTWSAGYFHKPLSLGADISVHAATKYAVGHSDALLGAIVCSERTYETIKATVHDYGLCAGPDDIYLTLRGMRTMGVRLKQHQQSAFAIAAYLMRQPEVARVLHPGLPESPDHALWKRDFSGASGLFGFVLDTHVAAKVAALVEGRKIFRIGKSWGGFESLLIPSGPEKYRTAAPWNVNGQTMRIQVGLEDVDDLIGDLDEGFQRMRSMLS